MTWKGRNDIRGLAIRWRDAATVSFAVLMVSAAALYNGYPLVYWDTGAYLIGNNYGERSIFYGLFLAPAHLTHTLWSVVFAQSLLLVLLLRMVVREVFAMRSRVEFLVTIAVTCLMTSMPWYAGYLMPDIFTPVMVLGLFMLAFCWKHLGRWEQCFLLPLTFLATIVHYSHIPIAIGLLVVAGLFRWVTRGRGKGTPYLALPAAVIGAGILAIIVSNYVMFGIAAYSPSGYVFALARLVQSGPAVEYLRNNCPIHHYAACSLLDRMPMSSSRFLWSNPDLFGKHGFIERRVEAAEIVTGTIEDYPRWVLRDAIADSFTQLRLCNTGGGLESHATDYNPNVPLKSLYPAEFDAYINSRQNRGQLGVLRSIRELDLDFLILSILFCPFLALMLARHDGWLAVQLMVTVAGAILLNAIVTGAISEPIDRYGARVIWLIPLVAVGSLRYSLQLKFGNETARLEPQS